jgi:glutamate-ammonia-ligase adenylyltransferase
LRKFRRWTIAAASGAIGLKVVGNFLTTAMPNLADLVCSKLPKLNADSVRAVLGRFDADYLDRFPPEQIARHVEALLRLSAETPVQLQVDRGAEHVDCTVLAFDHPFAFSTITGLLAATGFDVVDSEAFTVPAPRIAPSSRKRTIQEIQRAARLRRHDPLQEPLLVDHFRGRLIGPVTTFKTWRSAFEPALLEALTLLDQERPESTERVKRMVNERFAVWLKSRRQTSGQNVIPPPPTIDLAVEQIPKATRLRLRAADVPGFLYALGTSLSLHGLQIEKTLATTVDGQAVDEIDVVDSVGKPLRDPQRIEQLRLSVLLTQNFAYFLDRSPDPFTALKRFEELSEKLVGSPQSAQWTTLLTQPAGLSDLAKILGASDPLWDDLISVQAETLMPVFWRHARGQEICPPAHSLARRLQETVSAAAPADFEQQRILLNQFKDHELFLIDLDHILSTEHADAMMQLLSERLVTLAENVVAVASGLVFTELVRLYGRPRDGDGRKVGFAAFGLGKLGGVALGYASDIELLFLYEADGRTEGGTRGSLENGEFFAILTRETRDSIRAKREGIFRVDLRLRPFGGGGPLANDKQQFARYYGPGGQAHAFEKLALVRLRWIAGDARLGFEIEQIRDQILYADGGRSLDFKSIWDVTDQMRSQHTKGRQLNAKYSPGALTDLETTIQLLQASHASHVPQLRTPRLAEAMAGLRRAEILSASEFEMLMGAYGLLRRLINAQRMLRGSALDLVLPAKESDELLHLARRMNYEAADQSNNVGTQLMLEFQKHTKAVRQFMGERFGRVG